MGDDEHDLDNFASFWLEEPMPDVLDLLQNSEIEPESRITVKSELDQAQEPQQRPRRAGSKRRHVVEVDDDVDAVRAFKRLSALPTLEWSRILSGFNYLQALETSMQSP